MPTVMRSKCNTNLLYVLQDRQLHSADDPARIRAVHGPYHRTSPQHDNGLRQSIGHEFRRSRRIRSPVHLTVGPQQPSLVDGQRNWGQKQRQALPYRQRRVFPKQYKRKC